MGSKKKAKRTELRKQCCDMRLVGSEYNKDNEHTGYVIYIEKTQTLQPIRKETLKQIVTQYKFANAVVEKDELRCLDCDINDLHRFKNTGKSLEVLSSDKVYLLGEIKDIKNKDLVLGYRLLINSVMPLDLEISKLSEALNKKDSQLKLVNSRLKNHELKVNNDIEIDRIFKSK